MHRCIRRDVEGGNLKGLAEKVGDQDCGIFGSMEFRRVFRKGVRNGVPDGYRSSSVFVAEAIVAVDSVVRKFKGLAGTEVGFL